VAVNLQPIPPDPVSNVKLWRDFFSNVYEILKQNQSAGEGGSIPFSSITYPDVENNAVFIGPLNNSGKASFRQLTLTDITNALSTWVGNAYITTLGTISDGTWQGDIITNNYLPPNVTGEFAPGSFQIEDGQFGFHIKKLQLTGTQQVQLSGNSRLSIRN
jgi:hypothetical protein